MQNALDHQGQLCCYSWYDHVRWELAWVLVEMSGVALGLFLALNKEQDALGNLVLSTIMGLSYFVRVHHYKALGEGKQADREI